jgi:uroporphyrinogen-III synthase
MARPLEGQTIALAESRQLEDLARMLEKEGASVLRYPLVGILDAPDPAPVNAWFRELIDGQFHLVLFYTGEGVRRLLGFAERAGWREEVLAALGKVRILTRGPKPGHALKEVGLIPTLSAETPTTDGIIATLRNQPLQGQVVGVQLYKEEPTALLPFLESAGATVRSVLPYVYAPASDTDRVADLIRRLEKGEIQALLFTSSPQVDRLLEVAQDRNQEDSLRKGLGRTRVAAVGPLVADRLHELGIPGAICPEQGFVMKNLVQHVKRELGKSD